MIIEFDPRKWFPPKYYDHDAEREKFLATAKAAPVDGSGQAVSGSAKAVEMTMGFFVNVKNDLRTTGAWLEKELTAVEGKAPTIERVIDASLTYVGPVLQMGLVALGDEPAAAIVGVVVAKAQADLKVASALVTDFGPNPKAASMFAAVKTDLSSVLTAANVTNKTTVATITKAVGEVGALSTAVETAASSIATAAKA